MLAHQESSRLIYDNGRGAFILLRYCSEATQMVPQDLQEIILEGQTAFLWEERVA